MNTEYLTTSQLDRACELLSSGEVVAIPTETVYGLACNALNPSAIEKVFQAKGRPSNNPLIVHIHDVGMLDPLVGFVPEIAIKWMEAFWPGPLTIIFPRGSIVPLAITAGLDSVAIRMPNHPVASEIIRKCRLPIAAPSANRSGKPSATTWQAVAEDLDGLIAAIVCDEPTRIGLESTVVNATTNPPCIMRRGAITLEQLRAISPSIAILDSLVHRDDSNNSNNQSASVASPGLLHKHYQPRACVRLFHGQKEIDLGSAMQQQASNTFPRMAYIGLDQPVVRERYALVLVCDNLDEYAASLFDFFRQADRLESDEIWCQSVEEQGLGAAIMDRLRRASQI